MHASFSVAYTPIARVFALFFFVLSLSSSSVRADAPKRDDVDTSKVEGILQAALKAWNAPGLAAVIVKDDRVVFLGGVGVRKIGDDTLVTPDTVFPFASLTKAFTATALGQLIDDGKADWDDPVRKHLRSFRLQDPLADRDVRLRDLLCHRTGLARHELLWYRAPWSVEETVRRMQFLEPHTPFRTTFEYNNLPYLAAGLAISETAGKPWPELMKQRILDPLGMKNVVFTSSEAQKKKDVATPHRRGADGKPVAIPWYPDDAQLRAAGSLKGSVRDLAPWLRTQLNGGQLDGKQIVSAKALLETHTPQIIVAVSAAVAREKGRTQSAYGLGWHVQDYRGHLVIEHGGANDGFRGRIILLPKERIGIALLVNLEETALLTAVGDSLVDLLLGLEKRDWNAHHLRSPREDEAEARKKALPKQQKGTRPSCDLDAYAGKYHEDAYGDAEIVRDGTELRLRWSSFAGPLRHYHFDSFVVTDASRLTNELVRFSLDGDGKIAELHLLGRRFRRVR
jgi:CubicO group peptidase (beta-lactamase class C family)